MIEYWERIKTFFQIKIDLLDLAARGLSLWAVVYILTKNYQQQSIAIACLLVVVLGVRKINEYVTITLDKFKKSKKGDYPFGRGGFDNTKDDGSPIDPVTPGEAKQEPKNDLNGFERHIKAYFKAEEYARLNQWGKSAESLEEALKICSDNIPLRLQLGIIYGERLKDKERAIYHCNQILELDSNNVSAKFNLAVYTNHLKGAKFSLPIYLEAEKLMEKFGLGGSEIDGKLNIFLGHDYRDTGNMEEAKKRYKKAIYILDKLANLGDKSSGFWLNDVKRNLAAMK